MTLLKLKENAIQSSYKITDLCVTGLHTTLGSMLKHWAPSQLKELQNDPRGVYVKNEYRFEIRTKDTSLISDFFEFCIKNNIPCEMHLTREEPSECICGSHNPEYNSFLLSTY